MYFFQFYKNVAALRWPVSVAIFVLTYFIQDLPAPPGLAILLCGVY